MHHISYLCTAGFDGIGGQGHGYGESNRCGVHLDTEGRCTHFTLLLLQDELGPGDPPGRSPQLQLVRMYRRGHAARDNQS